MFRYRATMEGAPAPGIWSLSIEEAPPKRQQLRDYFRMPVRLSVRVSRPIEDAGPMILRASNLSAGGILLLDPTGALALGDSVSLGLPVGSQGEVLRVSARVVRLQCDPGRVALAFEGVPESVRRVILRYLFREHRRNAKRGNRSRRRLARIRAIHERP
jgi:c-di-GMP-binding flagellar brake protein YcgR